jgi:hypothetical protein
MSEKRIVHIVSEPRPTKAQRRGYKDGTTWAESGRSFYDLEAVIAFASIEIPEVVDDKFHAHERELYEQMAAAFEGDELDRLEACSDTYRKGWLDGVIATYARIKQAFGKASSQPVET